MAEKISAIEERLFTELVNNVSEYVNVIQQNAMLLAKIFPTITSTS